MTEISDRKPWDADGLINASWRGFVQAAVSNASLTRSAATDALQVLAPEMLDAEGDALLTAVAGLYEDVGLITQPTYARLRNEINQEGETTSMRAFGVLRGPITQLAEATPWLMALTKKSMQDEVNTSIDADIATIDARLATETDQAIIDAFEEAKKQKRRRKTDLEARLERRR